MKRNCITCERPIIYVNIDSRNSAAIFITCRVCYKEVYSFLQDHIRYSLFSDLDANQLNVSRVNKDD